MTVAALVAGAARAAAQYPERTGYVTDAAGTVSAETRAQLDDLLADVHQETGAEIVTVIMTSIDGTIENTAQALLTRWQVGERAHNGGVVVIIVPPQQAAYVSVGERLKYLLPAETVERIVRTEFHPALRRGDATTSVVRGVRALAEAMREGVGLQPVEGEPAANPDDPIERQEGPVASAEDPSSADPGAGTDGGDWAASAVLALFVAVGSFLFGAGLASVRATPMIFGAVFGGFPYLVSFLMPSPGPRYALAAVAVAMIVNGFVRERRGVARHHPRP